MKRKLQTLVFTFGKKKNIVSGLLALSAMLMVFVARPVFAGTTGKISGNVKDAQTGEPLIGASVIIEGTKLGGITNIDGDYTIINISPGTYRVKARYVGYQDKFVGDVAVRVDYTTKVDFDLSTKDIQANEITVVAERPLVTKDQTSSAAVIGSQQIKSLPVENINQVTELQAGVVGGHFRGGRKGEVAYLVDGLSVTNVFDGNDGREGSVGVEASSVQELQVITGSFNAEYGQANSGVVNMVLKEGDVKYNGGLTFSGGDYVSGRSSLYENINNISPIANRNLEANLSGPVPGLGNVLSFYASGRGFYNDGYLYGARQYLPTDVIAKENPLANGSTVPMIRGLFKLDPSGNLAQDANGNFIIDRKNGKPVYVPYDPSSAANMLQYNGYQNFGTGDMSEVALNPYRLYTGQFKLTYKPSATIKIALNSLYQDEAFRPFTGDNYVWKENPDGNLQQFRVTSVNYLNATYTLSNSAFLTGGLSRYYTRFKDYVYANPTDPNYTDTRIFNEIYNNGYIFLPGGTNGSRDDIATTSYIAKADITDQVNQIHLVKAGIEFRQHTLAYDHIDLLTDATTGKITVPSASGFGHDNYTVFPREGSAYIQDKMEFKDFIVNLGIRFDYFDPQAVVPRDPSDPSYRVGDENLRLKSDAQYFADNGTYNRSRKVDPKYSISPRLGIAFPITERGVVHFSYGHFFQMPKLELLYRNLLYKFTETGLATGITDPFGNADLKPQKTVSGEIGIQQQFGKDVSVDLTVYFRDIRDNAGTQEVVNLYNGSKYTRFTNSDFGTVRGVIVSVSKRLSNNFNFSIDYTFQIAEGNSSDPQAAANSRAAGAQPETQLIPLDWDQRHTLNTTLAYTTPDWSASIISRYGSGYPYTPYNPQDKGGVSKFLQNSGLKPPTFSIDFKASKDIKFGGINATIYTQIFNLLDTGNQNTVYNTTGQADYTLDKIRLANTLQPLNSLDDFFKRPDYYSEPRRIVFGASVNF